MLGVFPSPEKRPYKLLHEMIKRIVFTLILIVGAIAAFGLWNSYEFRGVLFLTFIIVASFFAIAGELVVEKFPTIRTVRTFGEKWAEWNLDVNKLFASRAWWEMERRENPEVSEPTRIRVFCTTHVENLIDAVDGLSHRDKLRPISDVVRLVSYPDTRLARITHELRLYAALFSLVSLYQLLRPAPDTVFVLFSSKFGEALETLGHRPLEFFAALELTIFAVFATRLLGEMSNLRQYIK